MIIHNDNIITSCKQYLFDFAYIIPNFHLNLIVSFYINYILNTNILFRTNLYT